MEQKGRWGKMKEKRTWPWSRPDSVQSERAELEEQLAHTRLLMTQAYAGFNAVSDGDLVESYVYEIQALRARYSYLLRQRKALEEPAPAKAELPRTPPAPELTAVRDPAPKVLPIHPALPVA